MTMTRNESFLLKEMLPIWANYADGFVFFDDDSTDDTREFLENNKEKYNILSIISRMDDITGVLKIESDIRQELYNEALKHSNMIICMDSDEYLESVITKEQLEKVLSQEANCTYYLKWVQYTDKYNVRVDGGWKDNMTDRIGKYDNPMIYPPRQMHSLHMPQTPNYRIFPPEIMYIAHLQWIDKRRVGIKQYFWKITDYVNKLLHNADVVGKEAYDNSVNNFDWEYEKALKPLRINADIFSIQDIEKNDRLEFIKKYTKLYNIPNLGDWGLGIHDSCSLDK